MGAHGIAAPVNVSEGSTLTNEERVQIVRIVTEVVAGRIPVVIAMPPYGVRLPGFAAIVDFA